MSHINCTSKIPEGKEEQKRKEQETVEQEKAALFTIKKVAFYALFFYFGPALLVDCSPACATGEILNDAFSSIPAQPQLNNTLPQGLHETVPAQSTLLPAKTHEENIELIMSGRQLAREKVDEWNPRELTRRAVSMRNSSPPESMVAQLPLSDKDVMLAAVDRNTLRMLTIAAKGGGVPTLPYHP